ncbi:hypothetical protein L210DRAFT_3548380 [Boletus edulis BED1]|uniref:Secreted protein n=1 Tax=Boletus edulis BED1 TaxID=1328754 RepID=A0AAD4BP79_BOLED|nr:hypothetical protein L210DRAFT_3548380 [Boletus edulis BED1]
MSSLIYNLFCFLLPANCASDAALVCLFFGESNFPKGDIEWFYPCSRPACSCRCPLCSMRSVSWWCHSKVRNT